MRPGYHAIAAAALLLLAGCENHPFRDPPPPRGPLLTGEVLQKTLAGNSLVTAADVIPPLTVYFDADGRMRGLHSSNYRDTGTWKVDDDAVCGEWENWWIIMHRCWQVYRSGDRVTLLRVKDQREVITVLVAGNAADL